MTATQLSLFDVPQLDDRSTSRKTCGRRKATPSVHRTPANEVMAYWLSGRTHRPSPGAVKGISGAVHTCLNAGFSVSEVCAALDILMRQDMDWSARSLLAHFGLAKPCKAKIDYDANPLFMRHHRQSAMSHHREQYLNRKDEALLEAARSRAQQTHASPPSSTGSLPTGAATVAPLSSEYHQAAREALYVQECHERGREPAPSSKGVIAGLMAKLRAGVAVVQ